MNEKYLLNHIIDLLLEYQFPVHYESSNPITFSFEYSKYKFYLVWNMENMGYEDIHLTHRAYLVDLDCSLTEILVYISHINEKREHIKVKLTEDYIAYIDSLSISPEYFTYEILKEELQSFVNLLDCMEKHISEVKDKINNAIRQHEKIILEEKQ